MEKRTVEQDTDCDYPQDRDAAGYLTHAECGCPPEAVLAYRLTAKP